MKQSIAAMLVVLLAGVAACGGARAPERGGEGTAAALAPNAGRGGISSPWLDDPESRQGTAGDERATAPGDAESSAGDSDALDDGDGDDSGDGGGDLAED